MHMSLSSRRAWIEISLYVSVMNQFSVALLTESVDRNIDPIAREDRLLWSLSSRRAWIEMVCLVRADRRRPVALLTESVDRNKPLPGGTQQYIGRSPHGERG